MGGSIQHSRRGDRRSPRGRLDDEGGEQVRVVAGKILRYTKALQARPGSGRILINEQGIIAAPRSD